MKVDYTKNAAEDISYWKNKDIKIYHRIKKIIDNIVENPFIGIGKPEALKYNLSSKWSRRITQEHRIVYEVVDEKMIIYQCRFDY
jgi:toxin YoeB